MKAIDHHSPVPLYYQLKTLIQAQIERGLFHPGDQLPTEQELCELYGISRSPVRQALNELAREGYVVRRPALGTFVGGPARPALAPSTPLHVLVSDRRWCAVLQHAANSWNRQHPERQLLPEVRLVHHDTMRDELIAAVGSGTAPDVAAVDCVWVAEFARAGYLYSLDTLDARWARHEYAGDLYPVSVEANSFQGQLYGIQFEADVSLLWYRRDWFEQEGLLPPADWYDLLRVGRHWMQPAVRERYGLRYPLVFPGGTAGGEATVYTLLPLIWSAGGAIVGPEGVTLDSPATRQALRFLQQLVHQEHISPPEVVSYQEHAARGLLASGQAAMALGGSYESSMIRDVSGWSAAEFDQRVGCAPTPAAPGGRPQATVGGTSYVILRQSQQPQWAVDLIKLATTQEVVGDLYRSLLLSSPSPTFNACAVVEPASLLAQTSRLVATSRARPSISEYARVSRQLQVLFEAALTASAPLDELVSRAAEFIGVLVERPVRLCRMVE